ncbi:hypothetical protein RY831_29110 [Noviherbaspirillum sp. CPCC 100848]|uniref:Uncharacterized protein n=1 Tax=Noviherbaspirillum album TaxID=3080276 RepID=A0ABU6JI89_9BURK|nr:hypothetical protein [Noviherbaspirillum sp. CPCC 100848]MEC4723223.1 hypothetical protein [Noviherbaspirillum sp. CPCC 100848]
MKRKILRSRASLSQIKPVKAGLGKCRNACDYPVGVRGMPGLPAPVTHRNQAAA